MAKRARRNQMRTFKAKVALAVIKGEKTLANWRSSSTSIRTRSRNGAVSFSKARQEFRARHDADSDACGRFESFHARSESWRWRTIFVRSARQGGSLSAKR